MSTPGTTAALPFLDPPGQEGSMGRLGPYEVLQILGQGAVGIVLKGYEPRLGRHVAIKVLAPQLVHSAAARRRFAREGKATAALGHDNIVAVHAVEDEGPRPYLVMEYVDGASLQQRLDRAGALPLAEVVRVGAGAARGLAAAHAHGLVHRDVKPGNILVEAGTGRVKLTDFGMVQHQDSVVSQTDVLAGTPLYMSPEQARGDKVDARSDLFSLGSVLYALCSGRPPFTGAGPLAVLRQIGEAAPPPLRRLNPAVPDWLAELIARMHDHDPAARPAAAEVARILEEHQSDPALAPRPRRRTWRVAAVVLFGLAAALVAAAVADLPQRLPLWLRGQARLVVRCDDPEATVRLAGHDEELVGEGEQTWTLPAGEYLVLTSRPGRPRQETPIRIGRGDTGTHHVEEPARPPDRGPFVVRPPDGGSARPFPDLVSAVADAAAGDVIEVRADGPFLVPPLTLSRPLTIRAADGFRPVLRHNGDDPKKPLLDAVRPLVLEGLVLEGDGFASFHEGYFMLVRSRGALLIAGCRLQVDRDGTCILCEGPRLELWRSLLLRFGDSGHGAINWSAPPRSEVLLDGSLVAGGHMGVQINPPPGAPRNLHVRRSTLAELKHAFTLVQNLTGLAQQPPAAPLLRLEMADSVLATSQAVFHSEQPVVEGREPLSQADALALLPKLVACRDRGSLYGSPPAGLLGFSSRWQTLAGRPPLPVLNEWRTFWGQPGAADGIQERDVFRGAGLAERLKADVGKLSAADFRLPDGSPGRGATRDGKDVGADVDLLGPGPPLARWRQTPEYDQWRRRAEGIISDKKEAP